MSAMNTNYQNVGVRRVEAPQRPHMLEIYALSPDDKIKACKTDQVCRLGLTH